MRLLLTVAGIHGEAVSAKYSVVGVPGVTSEAHPFFFAEQSNKFPHFYFNYPFVFRNFMVCSVFVVLLLYLSWNSVNKNMHSSSDV